MNTTHKIASLLIVPIALLFSACEPDVDEQYLQNSTNVESVDLVASQSTTGGNQITLEMTTPGVTGYWDYNLGKALSSKATFIHPIPGTSSFTFVGSLGNELFEKTIEVEVDTLDHRLDQDWYDLVGEETAEGKTWVFDGGPESDGGLWWFMSENNNIDNAMGAWWNAAGECCPPVDAAGRMTFDLDGAANYTYYANQSGEGQLSSFILDVPNQQLIINDGNILGAENGSPDGIYDIVSLTEDEMILYVPITPAGDSGWTWIFRPADEVE